MMSNFKTISAFDEVLFALKGFKKISKLHIITLVR